MCGICGVAFAEPRPVDRTLVLDPLRTLTHRGPDEEGVWTGPGVALGVERLAIVDLETGTQPIANEAGDVLVAFNGEIYNHGGLRPPLEKKGHRFQTKSDTEVLVHLYEERGERLVEDLDGMYAFGLWDAKRRRLLLARDPFGIKPLYYAELPGALWFASEIQALARVGGIDRSIDPEALQLYFLLGHVPHPRSIWKGVRKLPPGSVLVWEAGRLKVERFSRPRFQHSSAMGDQEHLSRVEQALRSTVRAQLHADVPLGLLLSGGIDSSLIAAVAADSCGPIETFCAGFETGPHDERRFARETARVLETRHHEAQVRCPERETLGRIVGRFGEPFADSSAIALDAVSALARSRVKGVLSGEGADELFGGYAERYVWDPVAGDIGRLPRWMIGAAKAAGAAAGALPGSAAKNAARRVRKLAAGAELPPADRYLWWFALFPDGLRRDLLGEQYGNVENPFAGVFAETEGRPNIDRLSAADLEMTLPGDMLAKSDRVSMGHGLELRVPFLSRELSQAAFALPPAMRVRGRTTKVVLRKLAEKRFGPDLARRPKHGFEVPIADWMRGSWKPMLDDLWEGPANPAEGLNRSVLRALRARLDAGEDHAAHPLYAALVFSLWKEQ